MDFLEKITYELAIETTKLLNEKQKELNEIKWAEGEANIDVGFSKIACITCLEAWEKIKEIKKLRDDIKLECDIPDINLTFTDKYNRSLKSKIELKSSKQSNKRIPGSTIGKLDINQPLIYCLRPKNDNGIFYLRCCQYHQAMGKSDTELFQDRTPRPYINFHKMKYVKKYEHVHKNDWIKHYSQCALNRLEKNMKKSWQDYLVKNIKEMSIEEFIKNTTLEEFIKLKENYF